jgi:hypothetical protein
MLCRKLEDLATHQQGVRSVQGAPSHPEFRITIAAAPAANELVQPRNVRGAGVVMHARLTGTRPLNY